MVPRQDLEIGHIQKRLQRCLDMNKRFSNGWHRFVIWSDEKLFTIESYNRQNDRLWMKNAPSTEDRIVGHVQHPRQVMVWAGICYDAKLPLVFVCPDYSFNASYYLQKILREVVRPWTSIQFPNEDWCFQQEGSPLHTAKKTQAWLQRNTPDFITKKQCPPRTPGLNPLDYSVWSVLEDRACLQPHRSLQSLKEALQHEWDSFSMESIRRIVDDFPRIIEACIEARGKHFQ